MRELVLDKIEYLQLREGGSFSSGSMRWGKYYIVPNVGFKYFYSKKEKRENGGEHAIKLGDATREDFNTLGDLELIECFMSLVRIANKQM